MALVHASFANWFFWICENKLYKLYKKPKENILGSSYAKKETVNIDILILPRNRGIVTESLCSLLEEWVDFPQK